MNRRNIALIAIAVLASQAVTACTASSTRTRALLSTEDASAVVAMPDGDFAYAERNTGMIWKVSKAGIRSPQPIGQAPVGPQGGSLQDIAYDGQRMFGSWMAKDGTVTVGQVVPGPPHVLWKSPPNSPAQPGHTLAISPEGRVTFATTAAENNTNGPDARGQVLTFDAKDSTEQLPNVISSGWHEPLAIMYDQSGSLWIADRSTNGATRIARVAQGPSAPQATQLQPGSTPLALTKYSDQELVACLTGTHQLKRFLVENARAIPGRVIASDCTGSVTELTNGQLVYVSGNSVSGNLLRITPK